jgi:hypothetical protein
MPEQTPRIAPLQAPYPPGVQEMLAKWMPPASDAEPLALFRTLAVHAELMSRMRPLGAGILGARATVPPQLREIVIHRTSTLSDELWLQLAARFEDAQIIELIVTAGWYHVIGYLCNGLGVQDEAWARAFPGVEDHGAGIVPATG